MEDAITAFCDKFFGPALRSVFVPINDALGMIPNWMAGWCGVGIFVLTMLWVGLLLNPKYVNRGRPYKSIWTDLRFWTVISMTPHVVVYFYFR